VSYTPFTATDAADFSLAADFLDCRAALAEVRRTHDNDSRDALYTAVERALYVLVRTEERAADLGRQVYHADGASREHAQRYPHPLAMVPIENCFCAGCSELVVMVICWHGKQCMDTPADDSCGHCWHEQHGHACPDIEDNPHGDHAECLKLQKREAPPAS
jgi:hypothetical protein